MKKYSLLACVLLILTSAACSKAPETNSLTKGKNTLKACVIDNNYTTKLTNLGVSMEVNKNSLILTNTTQVAKDVKINIGLKKYNLKPQESVTLYNIVDQDRCVKAKIL